MSQMIEVAVYQLKENASREQFLQLCDASQPDFEKIDGFIRREMSQSADGRFLDLVYYESPEAAKAAEPILHSAQSILNVVALIDLDSGIFFHTTAVS